MPRGKKRTTMTGAPAQKIESVPGQRYGEGVEQQRLQRTLPAPDGDAPIVASSSTGAGGPPPEATGPTPVDPTQIQQYLSANRPSLLSGTQSPDEPVTAGLPTGPGPGPEVLTLGRSTTPLARYMMQLARDTGNDKWRRLAERAGL